MRSFKSLPIPVILEIVFFIGLIVGIPLAIIQLKQQQDVRSRATTANWYTSQSASTRCAQDGSEVIIEVTFSNTEPNYSSTAMNVKVTDQQTGKTFNMQSVRGGETRTGEIKTGRSSLSSGTVTFGLTWTDGHSGVDSRSATYRGISNCIAPTPTPTPSLTPSLTPSVEPSKTLTPKPSQTPTPKPSSTLTPKPSQTPTPKPSSTLTPKPSGTPTPTTKSTPTICPTLGPVKNVRIDCPNCP